MRANFEKAACWLTVTIIVRYSSTRYPLQSNKKFRELMSRVFSFFFLFFFFSTHIHAGKSALFKKAAEMCLAIERACVQMKCKIGPGNASELGSLLEEVDAAVLSIRSRLNEFVKRQKEYLALIEKEKEGAQSKVSESEKTIKQLEVSLRSAEEKLVRLQDPNLMTSLLADIVEVNSNGFKANLNRKTQNEISELKVELTRARSELANFTSLLASQVATTANEIRGRESAIEDAKSWSQKVEAALRVELHPTLRLYTEPRVPAGKLEVGKDSGAIAEVGPFQVASTHVTQAEWSALSSFNPSRVRGKDHPVENVSWASMLIYTVKLNDKLGLEQPLDFSLMDSGKFTGNWENGSLNFNGEESKLRVDLTKGGYRLLTEAEWLYLATNLGQSTGEYPHNLKSSDLEKFSVFGQTQTAKVKSKKPFIIKDQLIYDLTGNVSTYLLDAYQENMLSGHNPLQLEGTNRVIRGGNFSFDSGAQHLSHRTYVKNGVSSPEVGLRLVRSLP